jgi:hypothetical protein
LLTPSTILLFILEKNIKICFKAGPDNNRF